MLLKEDITKRIETDFAASANEALAMLAAAIEKTAELKADRIIRCILFLAHGNIAELQKFIKMAAGDPRDVMLAAEYSDHSQQHPVRIRDFNNTFDNCEKNISPYE